MTLENKRKAFEDVGQKKRRMKKPLKSGKSTWKRSLMSNQPGSDPLGEEVFHVVEVLDDSYMMPEQSTAKLNDLQRDLSSFMQRQDGTTDKISKILENQQSYLNDHGKAIQIVLEKHAYYDKVIPHLERKTTLTDRRLDMVEQKVDLVLNAQREASTSKEGPARSLAKCKYCSKQMLKTSLYYHIRKPYCPFLRETGKGAVKKPSGKSRRNM